jgi:uncharacterized protein YndB with AHSA1/START domain
MTAITAAPVVKEVQVACTPDRAFHVFAADIGRWWVKTHSIASSGQAEVVIQPRAGGAWYEIGKEGERCDWGRVAIWEPPTRLVLVWQLATNFTYDPKLYTEVEVTFAANDGGTVVRLEHRLLENYGAAAGQMSQVFDKPSGWGGLMAAFAAAV